MKNVVKYIPIISSHPRFKPCVDFWRMFLNDFEGDIDKLNTFLNISLRIHYRMCELGLTISDRARMLMGVGRFDLLVATEDELLKQLNETGIHIEVNLDEYDKDESLELNFINIVNRPYAIGSGPTFIRGGKSNLDKAIDSYNADNGNKLLYAEIQDVDGRMFENFFFESCCVDDFDGLIQLMKFTVKIFEFNCFINESAVNVLAQSKFEWLTRVVAKNPEANYMVVTVATEFKELYESLQLISSVQDYTLSDFKEYGYRVSINMYSEQSYPVYYLNRNPLSKFKQQLSDKTLNDFLGKYDRGELYHSMLEYIKNGQDEYFIKQMIEKDLMAGKNATKLCLIYDDVLAYVDLIKDIMKHHAGVSHTDWTVMLSGVPNKHEVIATVKNETICIINITRFV